MIGFEILLGLIYVKIEIMDVVCSFFWLGIWMKLFEILWSLIEELGRLLGFFVRLMLLNFVLGVLLGFMFWFLLIGLNGYSFMSIGRVVKGNIILLN